MKRKLKFLWQKLTRGYSDDEIWNLDVTLVKFLLPRLNRYCQINPDEELIEAIDGFEEFLKSPYIGNIDQNKFQRSIDIVHKRWRSLWY